MRKRVGYLAPWGHHMLPFATVGPGKKEENGFHSEMGRLLHAFAFRWAGALPEGRRGRGSAASRVPCTMGLGMGGQVNTAHLGWRRQVGAPSTGTAGTLPSVARPVGADRCASVSDCQGPHGPSLAPGDRLQPQKAEGCRLPLPGVRRGVKRRYPRHTGQKPPLVVAAAVRGG